MIRQSLSRRLTALVVLLCTLLYVAVGATPALADPITPPPGWSDPLPGYDPDDKNIPKTGLPSFDYQGVEHLRKWANLAPPTPAELFGLLPADKYPYGTYKRMIAEWNDKYAAEFADKSPEERQKRWKSFVNRHCSGYASNFRGAAFEQWNWTRRGIAGSPQWQFGQKIDSAIPVEPDAWPVPSTMTRAYESKDALSLSEDAQKQLKAYVQAVDKYGKQVVYLDRRRPGKKMRDLIAEANGETAINKARKDAGLPLVPAIVLRIEPADAQSVAAGPDADHIAALARRGYTGDPMSSGSVMVAPSAPQHPVDGALSDATATSADTPEEAAFEQEVAQGVAAATGNEDVAATEVGGVDFATLELRYVSDTYEGGSGLGFAFSADPAPEESPAYGGRRNALLASDSFFVWLALPTSAFTVNLNPDQPDDIIDARFGRTDAGRVLLEADLQMKKTVAKLIHPDTSTGKRFWDGLAGEKCLSMRQWIVPARALVREDKGQLYIIDAPLDVKMESDIVNSVGVGGSPGGGCTGQTEADTAHNETLFRATILPEINKAVNSAPEYADLRRVYISRVAAQFFRERSLTKRTAYSDLINKGNVDAWPSREPWDPKEVWRRFVKSYTDGEFKVEVRTERGDVVEVVTYVYGGVDLTQIPRAKLDAGAFAGKRPGLTDVVGRASRDVAVEEGQGLVWLGGRTTAVPLRELRGRRSAPTSSTAFWMVTTLPVLLWVVVGALLLARRRGRPSWRPR